MNPKDHSTTSVPKPGGKRMKDYNEIAQLKERNQIVLAGWLTFSLQYHTMLGGVLCKHYHHLNGEFLAKFI